VGAVYFGVRKNCWKVMKVGMQHWHEKKTVQHMYNSWNTLWGYVTATPGRGYKEVMSQDGMYTGQAEVVALCDVEVLFL